MVNLQKGPEVLAPAGDMERLKAAIRYGADAVYLGSTEFGMRASAASFGEEELPKAVELAHGAGVKVYLTCNTLPRSGEIDRMGNFLRWAGGCGVDAFIVTDLGVLGLLREVLPKAEVHISTQAGVVNWRAAAEFYRMGAKRVVLARELSLEEVREIRQRTPQELELEVFVHGAMCMSVSGRCLLSNYMTGRDANRGQCAQPCRWNYRLVEEKRPGQYYPVFEDEAGSYILNAKDLCLLEHLGELIEAGVSSLKIEGRAKSAYYVSVITNAYRMAADGYRTDPAGWQCPEWLSEEVRKVSHREYSTGFLFGTPDQRCSQGGYVRNWDIMAVVERWEAGRAFCRQRNKFCAGETLELLEPGKHPETLTLSELFDGEENPILDTRHADMAFSFPCGRKIVPGAILRKQVD